MKNEKAAITRYPSPIVKNDLSEKEKIELIASRFRDIMQALGLDITDESLAKSPLRVAKMYVNEVFSGLNLQNFPDIQLIDEEHTSDVGHHSLIVTKCSFISFCEHHFVPMTGTAFVAYIPKGKLIGLSKIHRVVRFFAKRPQLQERLTSQIADSLAILLHSEDIAVSLHAKHFCVMARGVHDESGATSTSYFGGIFKTDHQKRDEFFHAIDRFNKTATSSEESSYIE